MLANLTVNYIFFKKALIPSDLHVKTAGKKVRMMLTRQNPTKKGLKIKKSNSCTLQFNEAKASRLVLI